MATHELGFMAIRGAHDVRLHNVGIQEPKSAQITTRAMSIILLGEM